MASLTIENWIRGLTEGHDYLSQGGMRQWLQQQSTPRADREEAVSALESVGTVPLVDTRQTESGTKQLFQFENRGVSPLYEQGAIKALPLEMATQNAIGILKFFAAMRSSLGR